MGNGLGDVGVGDVGFGDVRRGTRGLGDSGTRGLGDSGTRWLGDSGTRGRGTRRGGDAWRLGDVMNKPDFCAEFVKYNFRWSYILLAVVYEEQRGFGVMRKITAMKEILDWNACQVTVTEYCCFCSRVVVFTSSPTPFFPFPIVFLEVRSLKWPVTIKNFALGL